MQFFSHNQQNIINKDLLRIYKNSRKNLESNIEIISIVCDYLFKAQGKRIRPMLMLIVSKCFALNRKKLTDNMATIIELIHTATLLHDDVVDESKMRRSMQSLADVTPDLGNKKIRDNQSAINSDGSDKQFEMIDEDKFNKVIEQNIKAIPKRKIPMHNRSGSKLRRSS